MAQEPELPAVRGAITAVQQQEGFDVGGYHVVTSATTQFFFIKGSAISASDARSILRTGAYVQVYGEKNRHEHTVTARQIKFKEESRVNLTGAGVIDRILTPGAQPVFRADGYPISLAADAHVNFSGGLKSIDEVDAGTWIHYEGRRDSSGQLIATRAEFVKPKMHKSNADPGPLLQVTNFPPGTVVDFDGTLRSDNGKRRKEDEGGSCGWYPLIDVPSVQEHVRRVGQSLIPQYQRDLPDEDPAKIHFRFYVVEEKEIRSEVWCHMGLVLVPVNVLNRLRGEQELAAVLADGVAASLERQPTGGVKFDKSEMLELAGFAALQAAGGLGAVGVGGIVVEHELKRRMEEQRARVALSLMADAGYDPWQAPEAWRRLSPREDPKDASRLKYPARAQYQLEILGLQYKPAAPTTSAAAQAVSSAASSPEKPD